MLKECVIERKLTIMSNMQKIFAEEIRRLARKEIKAALAPWIQQNKMLKQQLAKQNQMLKTLSKNAAKSAPVSAAGLADSQTAPTGKDASSGQSKSRKPVFRPAQLVAFRKKFSLSQKTLAKLLSVSLVSVTNWENGHSVPRMAMTAKINELRKMGKRKLTALLPENARKPRGKAKKTAVPPPRKPESAPAEETGKGA